MYPARTLKSPSLFHHHRLDAVAVRERTKELQSRSHPAALVHNSRLLYLYDAHHEAQRSSDFPKLELMDPHPGGSSSSPQPELHPTLSSNMYRNSPFGIPPLRDPLPLRSDGQPDFVQRLIKVRCVAVVRCSKRSRLWSQVAPPHPSLNGVLSFFHIGSIVCACTDPCMTDAECPSPAQPAFGRRVLAP